MYNLIHTQTLSHMYQFIKPFLDNKCLFLRNMEPLKGQSGGKKGQEGWPASLYRASWSTVKDKTEYDIETLFLLLTDCTGV